MRIHALRLSYIGSIESMLSSQGCGLALGLAEQGCGGGMTAATCSMCG